MSNAKRQELEGTRQGVVGMKDRDTRRVAARAVETVDGKTPNTFVDQHATEGATVYTDGLTACRGWENRDTPAHSAGEYVKYLNGARSTNGVESFRSMFQWAHKEAFHRLSPRHFQRCELSGRHSIRDLDTIRQIENVVVGLIGRHLFFRDLIAPNGASAVAD